MKWALSEFVFIFIWTAAFKKRQLNLLRLLLLFLPY